jgi:hypothetical protein
MPHVTGVSSRCRVWQQRFGTIGEGGGSTLWPPPDPGAPFPGTPIGFGGPASRLRPRLARGPSIETLVITPGSCHFYRSPFSRLRAWIPVGPSIVETAAPPTTITGTATLTAQGATLSAAGQLDIFDIGNDTAFFNAQSASMSAAGAQQVIGVGVLIGQNATMFGQGSVFTAGIVGTGLFNPGAATMVSSGLQDIIGQAVLTQSSATMVASGAGTTFAFGPEQVWQVLIEQNTKALELLRIIAAAVAGRSTGAGSERVTYKSPITGTQRIDATSADGKNRTTVTVDGSTP